MACTFIPLDSKTMPCESRGGVKRIAIKLLKDIDKIDYDSVLLGGQNVNPVTQILTIQPGQNWAVFAPQGNETTTANFESTRSGAATNVVHTIVAAYDAANSTTMAAANKLNKCCEPLFYAVEYNNGEILIGGFKFEGIDEAAPNTIAGNDILPINTPFRGVGSVDYGNAQTNETSTVLTFTGTDSNMPHLYTDTWDNLIAS